MISARPSPPPMTGFPDPIHDAQRIFRIVLEAMSHPGRIKSFGDLPPSPPPLYPSAAAICLGLVDFETPLWIDGKIGASARAVNHLKFHCACPMATAPGEARMALLADPLGGADLARFCLGTDELPETSTTMIIQVKDLKKGQGKRLSGPGIDGETNLSVRGLPEAFWDALKINHSLFPRGVDVILCTPGAIVCLPRTTMVGE